MSLALLFLYLMLNVFRMLIHPSSGACDLCAELFHGLYWSVRIEVFALVCLFCRECLVMTCVVVLESVFLQILATVVSYGCRVFLACSIFWWYFLNIFWCRVSEFRHIWFDVCWCCNIPFCVVSFWCVPYPLLPLTQHISALGIWFKSFGARA